jgi:hypothetical protein
MRQPARQTDDEGEVGLELDYPPGWVDLPMDPVIDPHAWGRAHAAATTPGLPAERIEAVARDLTDAALDARDGGPLCLLGLAYCPDPAGPVLAVVQAHLVAFGDDPLTLDEAEQMIGTEGENIGERTVQRRQLPCGPAVRVRRMRVDDRPGPAGNGPDGRVVEGVTWVALPPGLDGYAMLLGTWATVVLGDELAARVDELAVRLVVHNT